MADLDWPTAELPAAVLRARYQYAVPRNAIRTQMDSGLARERRRFSDPPLRVPVTWRMTAAQVSFFRSWVRARVGVAFFNIALPVDEGTPTVEARLVGDSIEVMPIRVATGAAGLYAVSADLEVRPPSPIPADLVDIIADLGSTDVLGASAALAPYDFDPAFAALVTASWP